MAERPGDPEALGRVAANRSVLAQLVDGAQPSSDGVGAWSPDGWIMRTHPGTGSLWLRIPSGPAYDDAVAGGTARPVDVLPGWVAVDPWRSDYASWIRGSAALTREFVPTDA